MSSGTESIKRLPPLSSGCNFRDFGGYETGDGRRVRWGLLYRSGTLTQLSYEDRAAVATLGIRAVCDLRRIDERTFHPDPHFGSDVAYLHWDSPFEVSPLRAQSFAESTGRSGARGVMIDMYARMPVTLVDRVRGLFASLLHGPGAPLLLHCAAGKDRTGFAAAMLLSVLGVPRDVIFADYVLTNQAVDLRTQLLGASAAGLGLTATVEAILALPREAQDAVLAADAEYLAASFDAIDSGYGSVDEYLQGVLGIDAIARRQLARALLEG